MKVIREDIRSKLKRRVNKTKYPDFKKENFKKAEVVKLQDGVAAIFNDLVYRVDETDDKPVAEAFFAYTKKNEEHIKPLVGGDDDLEYSKVYRAVMRLLTRQFQKAVEDISAKRYDFYDEELVPFEIKPYRGLSVELEQHIKRLFKIAKK